MEILRKFNRPALFLVIISFALLLIGLLIAFLIAGFFYFGEGRASQPSVVILQPDGSLNLTSGEGLVLRAEGQAAAGVKQIDFLVDGELEQQNVSESPSELTLQATFPWFSNAIGVHELSVIAYDTRGTASEPATVQIDVQPATVSQIQQGGEPVNEGEPQFPDPGEGEGSAGEAPPDGSGQAPGEGQPPSGGEPPPAEGQPPSEGQPPGGGEPPPVERLSPDDDLPPIGRNPPGEGEPIDLPPTVELTVNTFLGDDGFRNAFVTANAADAVGLNRIVFGHLTRNEGGVDFSTDSKDCAGQQSCTYEAVFFRLETGEETFIVQAFDSSGQAASNGPMFEIVEIACEPEPCAAADHDEPDWQPDIPPGAIIIDPVNVGFVVGITGIPHPPAAPSDMTGLSLSCDDNDCSISLSWVDNSDNETGFKILRNGQDLAVTGADVQQYLDQNVARGEGGAYVVRAFNQFGESRVSNNVVIVGGDRAVVASNLTASPWCAAPQGCEVDLSWTDNSDNEAGFKILRDDVVIAITGIDVSDYLDRDVIRGERYAYKVQVFNSSGPSAASNELIVFADNIRAPSDLAGKSIPCDPRCIFIDLSWADNSDNEDGFKILRNGQEIGSVGFNLNHYLDQDVVPDQQYSYAVKAYKQADESKESNTVGLGLGSSSYSISGRVVSECPYQIGLDNEVCFLGPFLCVDAAGPDCSPGTSDPWPAKDVTIELSRFNGWYQPIPHGTFSWNGGPSSEDITRLSETRTDEDGQFSFEGLGPGIYLVRPTSFGYPGDFALDSGSALRYSTPIMYIGISGRSPVVRFRSVVANNWPCGYEIVGTRGRTDDLFPDCVP